MMPLLESPVPLWAMASALAAGLSFVRGHPLPEVARVVAAQRFQGGVRLDRGWPCAPPSRKMTYAVEVVAAGVGGPLDSR